MAGALTWPFVGRTAVLARVTTRLDGGGHVILTGPPGLGKTRLAIEVGTALAGRGVTVHRVVASPAATPVPLAPFAGLVGAAVGGEAVTAARRALGADGRAGPGDPLLVVDDLHLLDDASATVLQQLLAGGNVRLLGTLRSTSTTVPAAVERLRHEPGVHHITVDPLAGADLLAMVEAALGAPLDGRSRQLLAHAAQGNPMYARELVEGSLATGALSARRGVFAFHGDLQATPLLEEVVLARLSPLDEAQRAAVELLAVGGRLPHRLVERIVGFEPLEQMERMGLLVVTGAELDVAHPLYRELTRARLGALSRMRIHRQLVEADRHDGPLEGRSAEEQLRGVVWAVRGGVPPDEPLLLAVAHHASNAGDTPLAGELAEEAFRSGGSTAAALLASWCASQLGRHDDAIASLRRVAEHEQDPWARTAMHLRIAEELWWTGRLDDGTAELRRGAAEPGPWTALLDAQHGVHAMLDGRLPEAIAATEPLLAHEHVWVRFVAALGFTLSCIYGGRPARGIEAAGALLASLGGQDVGLLGDPNLHLATQLVAMTHDGQVDAAVAFAEAAYASTVQLPSVQARAWAAMLAGQANAIAGQLPRAAAVLAEADRLWSSVGVQGFAAWCAAGRARAQAELGALDEAADSLAVAAAACRDGFQLNEHLLDIASAWVAAGQGDRRAAADALAAGLERTERHQQWTNLAEVWHEAARLDLLDLLPDQPATPSHLSPLGDARLAFVAARRAGDPAALDAVAQRFEALGCLLYAAEAAAAAAAGMRRTAPKEATRLEGVAGRLAARVGGASTPLLAGRAGAGPLTAREVEIAAMAADGLTNRQIADRLVVSERTVENHLYRVFIKLGVRGRDELGAALSGARGRA